MRGDTRGAVRPPAFLYRQTKRGLPRPGSGGSVLYCEKLPLEALAQRFGTPLYVYSATAIHQRLQAFEQAFRTVPHTICYSVKANSTVGILRLLARSNCGFDVVSGGELQRVLHVSPH